MFLKIGVKRIAITKRGEIPYDLDKENQDSYFIQESFGGIY